MTKAFCAACVGVVVVSGWTASGAAHRLPGDAAAAGARQRCQLVTGQALEKFYPVMPGWARGQPTSETDTGEQVSRTTVDFDRATSTISVELMDSCRKSRTASWSRSSPKPPTYRRSGARRI